MKEKKLNKRDIIFIVIISLLLITVIILSILLIKDKKTNPMTEYYDKKIITYEMENANFSKGEIIFIGDSITDLYHLDDYYDLNHKVYNRGIGGDTTEGVLKRLDVSLYALKPKVVVLMIGINDINGNKSDGLIERYEEIVKEIKKNLPNTILYCMSILPINDTIETYSTISYQKNNEIIINTNEEIKKITEKYDLVSYLDLFALVNTSEGLNKDYSDDGLHLNHNGFVIWTNLVKPYLEDIDE